ncbi:hypothetical protein CHS0354_040420 [Potamilus streckersoni]|uniref:Transglutaminase-like domain-containing protein n=1 Tax=Potamilus streckersoni TaxID=2493646 RepID=A0AAE0W3Z8_9BIVA|nr:hypothetical protein CHS0354_040420 [Potamilus streckersoni]
MQVISSSTSKSDSSVEVPPHTTKKLNIVPEPNISKSINDQDLKVDTIGYSAEVPPHPPKTKKRDIIPDPTIFKDIDEHALKAPTSLRRSINELANYLEKPAKNNLERVRAFYRWITDNITYDLEGYFSGGLISSCDPHDVLTTGRSVCQGYADLFSAFCREVNIPVKTISGHSNGYSYDPEIALTPSTKTDHAWNVVLLNGDWRFVECTWGAGLVKKKQFYKEFTEFYFLTDPEDFISQHFPRMNKNEELGLEWQLMNKTISLEEFSRRVPLYRTALEFGIIPLSHKSGVLEVKSDDTITIQDGQRNIENWTIHFFLSDGTNMNNYTMSYMQNPTTLKINVRPPAAAKYVLRLFAKPRGKQTDVYHVVLEYIIKCSDRAKPVKPYVSSKTPWAVCPKYAQYGFPEKALAIPMFISKDGELIINIPTTRQVDAMANLEHAENKDKCLEQYTLIESSANKIVVRARLPMEGYYGLYIMVKPPWEGNDLYWPAIAYLIDCRKPMISCYPFPERFHGAAAKHNCRILEPLKGLLPPKSIVKFRLESNILRRIIILKQNLSTTGNGIFEGTILIPDTGTITVYGSANDSGSLEGLYRFDVAA